MLFDNFKTRNIYKNILIITASRDELGSSVSFVKDINDIQEPDYREMIINCINNNRWRNGDLWVNNDMCGSDRGYIFNDYALFDENLPIKVEYIINYVF